MILPSRTVLPSLLCVIAPTEDYNIFLEHWGKWHSPPKGGDRDLDTC